MILSDSARAPLMALVPILHWTGGLTFELLLVIAFALGALSAPYFAAQKVIVPELLGEDEEHRSVRAGLRFLRQDKLLRAWWPAFALGDAAWTAFFISVPVLVLTRFGHHAWIAGWLIASFGVGALIGNFVSFRYLARRYDGLGIIAALVMGQALPLWLLWMDLPAAVLSAVILTSGIANGLVNPSLHAISTLRVPPALRPNVLTVTMVGWAVVNPLGLFVTGPVLDAFGTTPVLVGFAAMQTAMMSVVAVASLRERARRVPEPMSAAA